MTIYTSNYARKGTDPNAIAISVGLKDWNKHLPQLKQLAPTWDMVLGNLSQEEYTERYIALLEQRKVDLQKIIDLDNDNEDYFLLCYESPKDFCHRHLLADWIKSKTGIIIQEWQNPKEREQTKQKKLVDTLLKF